MTNGSIDVGLHFNMPIRGTQISILEASAVNFYNLSDPLKLNGVCWMKYRGPKHVLLNSTNNCMTDVVHWASGSITSVRMRVCERDSDKLKISEGLYEKDGCFNTAPLNKRRIEDHEINGINWIYCYPFNITMGNETSPCPDYPFEQQ